MASKALVTFLPSFWHLEDQCLEETRKQTCSKHSRQPNTGIRFSRRVESRFTGKAPNAILFGTGEYTTGLTPSGQAGVSLVPLEFQVWRRGIFWNWLTVSWVWKVACQQYHNVNFSFFAIFRFVEVLQMKHAFPYLFLWSFSVHDVCASLGPISWDFPVLFRRQNPTNPWEWYWALSGNWIWKKFSHFDFCFHFFLWLKKTIRSFMWVWAWFWWVLFWESFCNLRSDSPFLIRGPKER